MQIQSNLRILLRYDLFYEATEWKAELLIKKDNLIQLSLYK